MGKTQNVSIPPWGVFLAIGFQIMFLARLEGAPLSKAYNEYVVEGGRLITQPKNFIWKTIEPVAITGRKLLGRYRLWQQFQPGDYSDRAPAID